MNITKASPVEIDTTLAALYNERVSASMKVISAEESLMRTAGAKRDYYYKTWSLTLAQALDAVQALTSDDRSWIASDAKHTLERLEQAKAAVAAVDAKMAPLNAEYERRGRWTRAFLVTNTGGHIHSSMNCGTCFPTTQYAWLPELSGHDESEIIAKAGSDACTACFKDAPVSDLKRPRSIFTGDEIAAQEARAKREQEKADRLAKKVANALTADGSEFRVTWIRKNAGGHERDAQGRSTYVVKDREDSEHFKTERAALRWVVQYVSWGHDLDTDDMAPGFAQVIEAVATKHGKTVEAVRTEIQAKVAAKIKRDSRG